MYRRLLRVCCRNCPTRPTNLTPAGDERPGCHPPAAGQSSTRRRPSSQSGSWISAGGRRARGPPGPLALIHNLRPRAARTSGRLKEAEPLLHEVVQAWMKSEPDDPFIILSAMNYPNLLAGEARPYWLQGCRRTGPCDRWRPVKVSPFQRKTPAGSVLLIQDQSNGRWQEEKTRRLGITVTCSRTSHVASLGRTTTGRWGHLCAVDLFSRRGASLAPGLPPKTSPEGQTTPLLALGPEDPKDLSSAWPCRSMPGQRGTAGRELWLAAPQDIRRPRSQAKTRNRRWTGRGHGNLRRVSAAEVLGLAQGRPSSRMRAPGTPGGAPRMEAYLRWCRRSADGRIEARRVRRRSDAFDFSVDHNPGRIYVFDEKLPTTKDPSDLSVRMHAAHTATALFLAFRVRDQHVRADPVVARVPFKNDSVELFLDGDRMPNDFTLASQAGNFEGFQIIADVLGNRYWHLHADRSERPLAGKGRHGPHPRTGTSSSSRSRST